MAAASASQPEAGADAEAEGGNAAERSPSAAEQSPPGSASEGGTHFPGSSPVAEAAAQLAAVRLEERLGNGAGGSSEDDDAISTWSEVPSVAPSVAPSIHDAPHVQRRVTAQRQNAVRRGALAHAGRNAQKAKSKKSRDSLSASMQF